MAAAISEPVRQAADETTRMKMEAIGRLAGGVAHDFNNLLTVISGCTQILLEVDPDEAERKALLGDIAEAAERASSLTRQLLAFGRRQALHTESVDIAAHLGGLANLLRRLVGEHMESRFSVAADCGCAKVDPDQFDQVIVNLVLNARDAMPCGGTLTVSANQTQIDEPVHRCGVTVPPGFYVQVEVSDTGEGIAQEVLPHIFEPFFTTKRGKGGNGLGLATVYGIVKQHGGFIFVDSAPGAGTRFELLFPRTEAPAKPRIEAPADTAPNTAGGTILVVEDEPAVAKLAAQFLAADGYTIVEASNGHDALELLHRQAQNIDLVFTDVIMPKMGGPELARRASQQWQHLAFVFASGYLGDDVHKHSALPAGIQLVTKPFSRNELIGAVRQAMHSRRPV